MKNTFKSERKFRSIFTLIQMSEKMREEQIVLKFYVFETDAYDRINREAPTGVNDIWLMKFF